LDQVVLLLKVYNFTVMSPPHSQIWPNIFFKRCCYSRCYFQTQIWKFIFLKVKQTRNAGVVGNFYMPMFDIVCEICLINIVNISLSRQMPNIHWNPTASFSDMEPHLNSAGVMERLKRLCAGEVQQHAVSTHVAVTKRSTASRCEVEWRLPGKYSTEWRREFPGTLASSGECDRNAVSRHEHRILLRTV